MATFSDDFNRANGALGSDWETAAGGEAIEISSNVARAPAGNLFIRLESVKTATATFSADQEATVTIPTVSIFDFCGPAVRVTQSAGTGYFLQLDSLARIVLGRGVAGGSYVSIGTTAVAAVSGDVWKLRVCGTQLTAFRNGVIVARATDATYATGQPGLYYKLENNRWSTIDTFSATDALATLTITHQIAASGGDYTSLSAWEAAQQRDLVAADEIAVAECQAFQDTTAVSINGWTTDATRYIVIRAAAGAEAQMPWSASAYRLVAGIRVITVNENFVTLRALQLQTAVDDHNLAPVSLGLTFADLTVTGCHLRVGGTAAMTYGSYGTGVFAQDVPGNVFIVNTVVEIMGGIGAGRVSICALRSVNHNSGKTYLYNNTVIGNGVVTTALGIEDGYADTFAKNNLATGFLGGDFVNMTAGQCTNNASGDGTAVGAGARINQTFTFVDAAGGNYHLAAGDAGARGFGTDLSADPTYPFSTDFDGVTRTVPWDIGALIAALASGTGVARAVVTLTGQNRFTIRGNIDGSRMIINR